MEWQYYYNNLRKAQKTHTTQQYCLEFLQLINYKEELLTYENINDFLSSMPSVSHPNFNLFPFSENTKKIIDEGNYSLLAQLVFHLPYIDLTWMNYQSPAEYDTEKFYATLLGNSEQSMLYLNNISTANILKNEGDRYILTFLFLLCLPCCEKDTHLWDFHGNHICSVPFIIETNFNLLLEISKDSHLELFNSLCSSDNNISISLIENFMDLQIDLKDFKKTNWREHVPIYQLYKLAENNCYAKNITHIISNRYIAIYPNLIQFIENLNYEIFQSILESQIDYNNVENTKPIKF